MSIMSFGRGSRISRQVTPDIDNSNININYNYNTNMLPVHVNSKIGIDNRDHNAIGKTVAKNANTVAKSSIGSNSLLNQFTMQLSEKYIKIQTYLYIFIIVSTLIGGITYFMSLGSTFKQNFKIMFNIIQSISALCVMFPLCYILYKQCYLNFKIIFIYYLHEFRCVILILCIICLFFIRISKLLFSNIDSEWCAILSRIFSTSFAIFLVLARDSFAYPMPFYVSLFLVFLLFSISAAFMIDLEKDDSYNSYPKWLQFIEKQIIYQVFIITLLLFYNIIVDPKQKYFVLIRSKIKRYHLFGNKNDQTKTYKINYNMHDGISSSSKRLLRAPKIDTINYNNNQKSYAMIALTDLDNEMK